jgi:predicted RNA binding protein YcfA (HicA-like mRNA interferase family)
LAKMRNTPHQIRFGELEALLRYEGFVLFNQRGSHCTYHRPDGRVLTMVRPHGRRKTCHPTDIRKLLEALSR